MAQISTVALPQYTIPKTKTSRQARSIVMDFSPTMFTADVTVGDNILIATLPKDARIISAGIRLTGIAGAVNGFCQLRSTENSVSTAITDPLSTTYSGSILQSVASPAITPTFVKTVELLIGGGSIDRTTTGIIEITIHHDFLRLAG